MFYRYVFFQFGIRFDNMDGFPFCKNFLHLCFCKGKRGCEKFFSSLFIFFVGYLCQPVWHCVAAKRMEIFLFWNFERSFLENNFKWIFVGCSVMCVCIYIVVRNLTFYFAKGYIIKHLAHWKNNWKCNFTVRMLFISEKCVFGSIQCGDEGLNQCKYFRYKFDS